MSTFRYIEAPRVYRPAPGDPPAVFLAGGIPHVEDWHPDAVTLLDVARVPMVVLCPRREEFPVDDPRAGADQVAWEHRHLHIATVTLFWFAAPDPHAVIPAEFVVQPTTLVELGVALGEGRSIAVGAAASYPRPDILINQLRQYEHVELRDSLAATVADTVRLLGERGGSRG